MPASRALASTVLALATVGAAAPDSGLAADEWTRGHPAAAGARVEIVNHNGSIRAEATGGASVELVAKRVAPARDDEAARELLARIELRESVSASSVRIEVVDRIASERGNVAVDWTVRVPRGVNVDLRNENGSIALAALDGDVRARTENGAVTGRRLASSRVDAQTVNGRVALELARPLTGTGSVTLSAVNGAVELRLPSESRATLSARATNGVVRADGLELATTGKRSRTRLEATLGGGGTPVTLETTNGSARIGTATTKPATPRESGGETAPPVDPARVASGAVSA